jgi:hypothetical protein
MEAPAALSGDDLLGWVIRGIGLMWAIGAVYLALALRRESMLDRMIGKLDEASAQLAVDAGYAEGELNKLRNDPDADPEQIADLEAIVAARPGPKPRDAADEWSDRDDRNRRFWLAAQGVLLFVTGIAMAALHPFALWLVIALIACQGLYFIWRESVRRSAPTKEAADQAKPAQSTVNAGWFSLIAGALVWYASHRGVLQ